MCDSISLTLKLFSRMMWQKFTKLAWHLCKRMENAIWVSYLHVTVMVILRSQYSVHIIICIINVHFFLTGMFLVGVPWQLSGFQMTVEKLIPRLVLQPITTGAVSVMNQSGCLGNYLELSSNRGKNHAHGMQLLWLLCFVVGFGFASHGLVLSQSLSIAIAIA